MKNIKLKIFICIEIILVITGLFMVEHLSQREYTTLADRTHSKNFQSQEIYQEKSPDGTHTLVISRIGSPRNHHDEDWLNIYMFSTVDLKYPYAAHHSDLTEKFYNNGELASYAVEWLDIGAKITISGDHHRDQVYILPFYVPEESELQNSESAPPVQNPS